MRTILAFMKRHYVSIIIAFIILIYVVVPLFSYSATSAVDIIFGFAILAFIIFCIVDKRTSREKKKERKKKTRWYDNIDDCPPWI